MALASALVASVMWLGGYQAARDPYVIVTDASVAGLKPQSTVYYRGVEVGKVVSVEFSPDQFPQILIHIRVNSDIPIVQGTYAKLRPQGITGLSQIELAIQGDEMTPLSTSESKPTRIPMRPSEIEEAARSGQRLLTTANELSDRLKALLNTDNRTHINNILAHMDAVTEGLHQLETTLNTTLESVSTLSQDTQGTLERTNRLLARIEEVIPPLNRLIKQTAQLGSVGQRVGNQFTRTTLPKFEDGLDQLTQTTAELERLVHMLRQEPQSLLLGKQPPPPGPGEPGYRAGQ